MKKVCHVIVALLIILACISVAFLQPLRLVSGTRTRIAIHFGKSVPLEAIADVAGGYRCYVNDEEYFWLSDSECAEETGEPMRVVFQLNKPPTLYRRGT